ncbi:MAG: DUF2877 domain-containing protein [Negativicutes bacterium]|nr:DUF2877 domain-containing protein [Negativicutes bacterium]
MATVLKAVACDSQCIDRLLRPGFSGQVHSLFARVINFCDSNAVLYSLATADMDNAPNTVRVLLPADFRLDAAGIVCGDWLRSGCNCLTIAEKLVVDASGADRWQASLPRFPAAAQLDLLVANLAVLEGVIAAKGWSGGLKEVQPADGQGFSSLVSRELAARADSLFAALEDSDFSLALVHGRSLLGLGLGQTPSGDDFLGGLLAVLQMPGAPFEENYINLAKSLVQEAAQLTGAVSLAMLQQAGQGRVRESVTGLLEELTGGTPNEVAAAADRVLALGSTSGTDIAIGLARGLTHGLWLKKKETQEDRHAN